MLLPDDRPAGDLRVRPAPWRQRPAQDAQALARLLQGRKAHVNLIPYNPVAGLPFERPDPECDPPVRGDAARPRASA